MTIRKKYTQATKTEIRSELWIVAAVPMNTQESIAKIKPGGRGSWDGQKVGRVRKASTDRDKNQVVLSLR